LLGIRGRAGGLRRDRRRAGRPGANAAHRVRHQLWQRLVRPTDRVGRRLADSHRLAGRHQHLRRANADSFGERTGRAVRGLAHVPALGDAAARPSRRRARRESLLPAADAAEKSGRSPDRGRAVVAGSSKRSRARRRVERAAVRLAGWKRLTRLFLTIASSWLPRLAKHNRSPRYHLRLVPREVEREECCGVTQRAATTMISTFSCGRASLLSTQARAGGLP